ncbi:MAG: nicotinamide-nucleotide amidohydrolase family protein [Alphaproteobacteria bacterium]|nr:nicotinamide-nucleotide amidohydrolase family protein [Alphaproteobacteria bacterium]
MYFSRSSLELAQGIIKAAQDKGLTLTTAESCTGGLIAACLTEVAGASTVFMRGFVTYANVAKTDQLGVPADMIAEHGATSEEVARAMAEGALERARADIAVSATGIAGPGGGTPTKPVGLVHMAAVRRGGDTLHRADQFAGDRQAVRGQAVDAALALLLRQAETAPARD